jgi:hypothetical protein
VIGNLSFALRLGEVAALIRVVKIALPFNEKTVLRSYLYSAYPAGMATARQPLPANVLLHHTQLFFPAFKLTPEGIVRAHFRIFPGLGLDQYGALGWLRSTIADETLTSAMSCNECAERAYASLEQGRYVFVYIDEFYLPGSGFFHRRHHRHPLLITGCDRSRHLLLAMTYLASGVFGPTKIPISEFEAGIHSPRGKLPGRYSEKSVWKEIAWTDRPDEPMDKFQLARRIDDYLEGTDSSARYLGGDFAIPAYEQVGQVYWDSPDTVGGYGRGIYEYWRKYLQTVVSTNQNVDMRATRALMDHKELLAMSLQLAFTEQSEARKKSRSTLSDCRGRATALHNTALIWNSFKSPTTGKQMIQTIDQLEAAETAGLAEALRDLRGGG